jgi:hypothetical protein
MKKTLVIILGQARADKLTWDNFNKYVLNELDADLALCIGESDLNSEKNNFWKNAEFKWVHTEYQDYGIAYDELQKKIISDTSINLPNWRRLMRIGSDWLGSIKDVNEQPGSSGLLLYFKWHLMNHLMDEEILEKYDWFVITRSDFIWELPHPPITFFKNHEIGLPYGEHYGGYSDRHVVMKKEAIKGYFGIIEPILKNPEKLYSEMEFYNKWNHEKYIYHRIKTDLAMLKIKYMPYMMYSVREFDTHTTWSHGKFSEHMGLYIKYDSEYYSASTSKKIMKICRNWNNLFATILFSNVIIRIIFIINRPYEDLRFRVSYFLNKKNKKYLNIFNKIYNLIQKFYHYSKNLIT